MATSTKMESTNISTTETIASVISEIHSKTVFNLISKYDSEATGTCFG